MNEADLEDLTKKCKEHGLLVTQFREPDLDNQLTAIAIEPSKQTERLVGKLPRLLNKDTINQYETRRKNSLKINGYQSKSL